MEVGWEWDLGLGAGLVEGGLGVEEMGLRRCLDLRTNIVEMGWVCYVMK